MNKLIVAFFGLSLVLTAGCTSPRAEFRPPSGVIYTNYKAPLLIDYNKASVENQKGSASTEYIRDAILTGILDASWGDSSIKKASENGRITKVGTADYEYFSIFQIYAKTTVHVHGPQ